MDDDAFDLLSDDNINDSFEDISILSEADFDQKSVNVDFSNGSPLNDNDFKLVHYNISSRRADGRLESIAHVCKLVKIDILILTESKLDITIPTNLINIFSYHEPIRRERNCYGVGC